MRCTRRRGGTQSERNTQQTMNQTNQPTAMHFSRHTPTSTPTKLCCPQPGSCWDLVLMLLLKQMLGISEKIKFTLADFKYR